MLTDIQASPGNPGTRISDGRCDRAGNFVFGTMHKGVPQERAGAFYRLDAQTLAIESLALPGVAIENSICFSPDGTTMYYCDSLLPHIFCCDYPSIEHQRLFSDVIGGPSGDMLFCTSASAGIATPSDADGALLAMRWRA